MLSERREVPKYNSSRIIRFSSHALKRLQERDLSVDEDEFLRLESALQKLKNKGGRDSLVITDIAAYILDVHNSTIVTAVEKRCLRDNIFTKIDSTMILN